jgi:cell division protein FtsB
MAIFLQYVLPSLIAALAGTIGIYLNVQVQKRKVENDDDACLRDALMQERKQLVGEIADLQKRCDALEETNREQAREMAELRERNRKLVAEIKNFGSGLTNEEA